MVQFVNDLSDASTDVEQSSGPPTAISVPDPQTASGGMHRWPTPTVRVWGSACQGHVRVQGRCMRTYQKLAPLCRHHHRAKQAEGLLLEQPEPGVLIWKVPSGRTCATSATIYPH
jgi:hypothetical protein